MNRSLSRKAPTNRNKGFTLVEIMVVITIVVTLATLAITNVPEFLRRNRVTSVVGSMEQITSAASQYVTKTGTLATLPLTEGTIPATQFSGAGTTTANVAAAGTLDMVLLTEGLLQKPLTMKMGPQNSSVTGVDVTWSVANDRFEATAAPTADRATISRAEVRISAPATAPSTALGANFRLDGTNDLDSNVRVAYLVIPNVPAEDAYQLSLTVDSSALSQTDNTTADDRGQIVYAAPANGVTTVYAYLTRF